MDIHGYPWISMDIHGYPWILMGLHGSPWATEELVWAGMAIHDLDLLYG